MPHHMNIIVHDDVWGFLKEFPADEPDASYATAQTDVRIRALPAGVPERAS